MERKLAAILAADVVGYSALMEADEAGTHGRLKAVRKELFEPEIARHHGHIFKLMGDGMLAEFGSVVDAVECAVSLQRGLGERNANVPEDQRVQVRIGINLGEVIVEGDDRYGEGVNIAARLEQLADPGGICVSGKVAREVEKKLAIGFEAMGAQQVKNIAEPIQAFRVRLDGAPVKSMAPVSPKRALPWMAAVAAIVLLAGGAWFALRAPAPEPAVATDTKPSIAVLPFDNLSGDETTTRLASGITEDLITDLSHIRKIDVIARNSTEVYKGRPIDVRSVGRDLNVRYVFEGSVQHEGDQIRVTAQLIDAATGVHVWSERWDRRAQDVFAVQTEIAEQIVAQMEVTYGPLNTPELAAARRKRPENLTAYELNLLGVEKQLNPSPESLDESLQILNQAVKADPNFARAWINLAWAHEMRGEYGGDWAVESQASLEAAERATRLDPNDAEAHSVLGTALARTGDMGRAKAEFDTSLQLGPSSAAILTYYVGWASTFGEPERGAELADRAIRLNPNYQPWATAAFRFAYFMAGRYQDALRVMERQTPDNYNKYAWAQRAGSFAALGRMAEAQATVKEALKRHPSLTIEAIVNNPGFNEVERQRLIDTMRLAGFPACAQPEEISKLAKPFRLSECEVKP